MTNFIQTEKSFLENIINNHKDKKDLIIYFKHENNFHVHTSENIHNLLNELKENNISFITSSDFEFTQKNLTEIVTLLSKLYQDLTVDAILKDLQSVCKKVRSADENNRTSVYTQVIYLDGTDIKVAPVYKLSPHSSTTFHTSRISD